MPTRRTAPSNAAPRKAGAGPDSTVKDHILDRTIFLVGKKGTTDVTVREIAREAGVNVAAVNYYFSSKEQMFDQMAARFTAGFGDVMRLLETPDTPPEARLRRWSWEVMRHLAEYPGFLAVMERHLTGEPADPFARALRAAMRQAVRRLTATLEERFGARDPSLINFKLSLLVAALAGPLPRLVGKPQTRPGARGTFARARFLDLLLEHLAR